MIDVFGLFYWHLTMAFYTTRHCHTSGRLVQKLNVCTVLMVFGILTVCNISAILRASRDMNIRHFNALLQKIICTFCIFINTHPHIQLQNLGESSPSIMWFKNSFELRRSTRHVYLSNIWVYMQKREKRQFLDVFLLKEGIYEIVQIDICIR